MPVCIASQNMTMCAVEVGAHLCRASVCTWHGEMRHACDVTRKTGLRWDNFWNATSAGRREKDKGIYRRPQEVVTRT